MVRQVPPQRREVASEAVTGRYVRFTPKSGPVRCTSLCLLCAKSGHSRNDLHKTERPPRGGLSEIRSAAVLNQPAACAFRFLRHPRRPNAPRPVANSGRVAGKGVAVTPSSEKAALNVGGVVPPTMSVPMRDQSGSSAASRIQLCKSVKPAGNEGFGRSPDSQKNSPPLTCTWGTKK